MARAMSNKLQASEHVRSREKPPHHGLWSPEPEGESERSLAGLAGIRSISTGTRPRLQSARPVTHGSDSPVFQKGGSESPETLGAALLNMSSPDPEGMHTGLSAAMAQWVDGGESNIHSICETLRSCVEAGELVERTPLRLEIEACAASRPSLSLRGGVDKYQVHVSQFKKVLQTFQRGAGRALRRRSHSALQYCTMVCLPEPRLYSFEVSLAWSHKGAEYRVLLFSKLKSKDWPSPSSLLGTLAEVLHFLHSLHAVNLVALQLNEEQRRLTAEKATLQHSIQVSKDAVFVAEARAQISQTEALRLQESLRVREEEIAVLISKDTHVHLTNRIQKLEEDNAHLASNLAEANARSEELQKQLSLQTEEMLNFRAEAHKRECSARDAYTDSLKFFEKDCKHKLQELDVQYRELEDDLSSERLVSVHLQAKLDCAVAHVSDEMNAIAGAVATADSVLSCLTDTLTRYLDSTREAGQAVDSVFQKKIVHKTNARYAAEGAREMQIGSACVDLIPVHAFIGRPFLEYGTGENKEVELMYAEFSADTAVTSDKYGGIESTLALEWQFVVEPREDVSYAGQEGKVDVCSGLRFPVRIPRKLEAIIKHDMVIKAKLERSEIIALRLYTGVAHGILNTALRQAWCESNGSPSQKSWQAVEPCASRCSFAVTLTVLNSAIMKLSRVNGPYIHRTLYRGVQGICMPDHLFGFGPGSITGFVETAFVSCSPRKDVALQYAGQCKCPLRKDEEDTVFCTLHKSTLLEISTGASGSGAWLGWVSQFPDEDEYCLPAGSFFQVTSVRRERHVNVFQLSIHDNSSGITLGQIRGQRKTDVLAFGDNMFEEARQLLLCSSAVARQLHSELVRLNNAKASFADIYNSKSIEWFHSISNYQGALNHVVGDWRSILESAVLSVLAWLRENEGAESTWNSDEKQDALNMHRVALLLMQRCADETVGTENIGVLRKKLAQFSLAIGAESGITDGQAAQYWQEYGDHLQKSSSYALALSAFQQALALHKQTEGIPGYSPGIPSVCKTLCRIGNVYRLLGEMERAIETLEEAQAQAKAIDCKYHPIMADVAQAMALCYITQAKPREALLQCEGSLRIKMVYLSVHHESIQEDLGTIHHLVAKANFDKLTSRFRAFQRFFWIITNASNPHRASSDNESALKEVVDYMSTAKKLSAAAAEWGLRVLTAAAGCIAEEAAILSKIETHVICDVVGVCMQKFCGNAQVQEAGLQALNALCSQAVFPSAITTLDVTGIWRAMATHLKHRDIQIEGLSVLRRLADNHREKEDETDLAQKQIDEFMAGKDLKFEDNSWDTHATAANVPILEGLASIFMEHPELAIDVHGVQAGATTKQLVKDPMNDKTFDECFPGVTNAVTADCLARSRVMSIIDALRAIGCVNAMSSTTEVASVNQTLFNVQRVQVRKDNQMRSKTGTQQANVAKTIVQERRILSTTERSVLSTIVAAMKCHRGDSLLLQSSCTVLWGIIANSSPAVRSRIALEAKEIISEVLKCHQNAVNLASTCTRCLELLAYQPTAYEAFFCRFGILNSEEAKMRLHSVNSAVAASEAQADALLSDLAQLATAVEEDLSMAMSIVITPRINTVPATIQIKFACFQNDNEYLGDICITDNSSWLEMMGMLYEVVGGDVVFTFPNPADTEGRVEVSSTTEWLNFLETLRLYRDALQDNVLKIEVERKSHLSIGDDKKMANMEKELNLIRSALDELQVEYKILPTNLESKHRATLQAEHDLLVVDHAQLTVQLDELNTKHAALEADYTTALLKGQSSLAEIAVFRSKCQADQETLSALQAMVQESKTQLQGRQTDFEQLMTKCTTMEVEMVDLKQELRKFHQQQAEDSALVDARQQYTHDVQQLTGMAIAFEDCLQQSLASYEQCLERVAYTFANTEKMRESLMMEGFSITSQLEGILACLDAVEEERKTLLAERAQDAVLWADERTRQSAFHQQIQAQAKAMFCETTELFESMKGVQIEVKDVGRSVVQASMSGHWDSADTRAIIDAMLASPECMHTQEIGCMTLWSLCQGDDRNSILYRIAKGRGIDVVIAAMILLRDLLAVQEAGCAILCALALNNEETIAKLHADGGVEVTADALKTHWTSVILVQHALGFLRVTASLTENRASMTLLVPFLSIVDSMRAFRSKALVAEHGLSLLAFLLTAHKGNIANAIQDAPVAEAVFDCMKTHLHNPEILELACDALHELNIHGKSILDFELQTEAIRLLLPVVDTYKNNEVILPKAITILTHLTHSEKNAVHVASGAGITRIASILAAKSDLVARVPSLVRTPSDAELIERSSTAVPVLMVDCFILLKQISYQPTFQIIAREGAITAVLECMNVCPENVEVQLEGSRALKAFAAAAANSIRVVEGNAVAVVSKAFTDFPDHADLQDVVLELLDLLADQAENVREIITGGGVQSVLDRLREVPEDHDARERHAEVLTSACSLFIKLAVSDEDRTEILLFGAVHVILDGIRMHQNGQHGAPCLEEGFKALMELAVCSACQQDIGKAGGVDLAFQVFRSSLHAAVPTVLENGMGLLWNLAYDQENLAEIYACGGLEWVLTMMRQHQDLPKLLDRACAVLWNFTCNEGHACEIARLGGIGVIVKSMRCHLNHHGVQESGRGALRGLTKGAISRVLELESFDEDTSMALTSQRRHNDRRNQCGSSFLNDSVRAGGQTSSPEARPAKCYGRRGSIIPVTEVTEQDRSDIICFICKHTKSGRVEVQFQDFRMPFHDFSFELSTLFNLDDGLGAVFVYSWMGVATAVTDNESFHTCKTRIEDLYCGRGDQALAITIHQQHEIDSVMAAVTTAVAGVQTPPEMMPARAASSSHSTDDQETFTEDADEEARGHSSSQEAASQTGRVHGGGDAAAAKPGEGFGGHSRDEGGFGASTLPLPEKKPLGTIKLRHTLQGKDALSESHFPYYQDSTPGTLESEAQEFVKKCGIPETHIPAIVQAALSKQTKILAGAKKKSELKKRGRHVEESKHA